MSRCVSSPHRLYRQDLTALHPKITHTETAPLDSEGTLENGRQKTSVAIRFLFAIIRAWLLLEGKKRSSTSSSRLWPATAIPLLLKRLRAEWSSRAWPRFTSTSLTLKRRGLLDRVHNRSRSIDVLPPGTRTRSSDRLPLVGRIAAGFPVETFENSESISLHDVVGNRDVFALEVRGDSMRDEHIINGDYVLVERTRTARQGEIVVALVHGSETTLKRFYSEGTRFTPAARQYRDGADLCPCRTSGDSRARAGGSAQIPLDSLQPSQSQKQKRPGIARRAFLRLAQCLEMRLLAPVQRRCTFSSITS